MSLENIGRWIYVIVLFFFFSSRRRHTRWPRDWSSDVCSSDLKDGHTRVRQPAGQLEHPDLDAPSSGRIIPRQEQDLHRLGIVDCGWRIGNGGRDRKSVGVGKEWGGGWGG